nr:galactokinase [Candidatus Korarchaeota archaeon]NIU85434.1 galactokinase [Candidatus Thorarchaeota archaeon]NIW15544.1 galactokinase [Candidatus Thorarchaeota archaeon]NIW53486.1 galactokinase [Candidatus Korarchaeota archaeon]
MFHITSPGRINLIGEHTDYTNGYVMPMAINLHTTLEAKPADVVEVYSEAFDEVKQFKLTDLSRENSWIDYVKGIYAVLFEEGYLPGGMKAQAGGDLPLNAGLSSSASFELAIIAFLNTAYDLDLSREGMALLSQKAENEFVDVPCGIMDQFTIGLSQAHHALFLDTETLEYEYVPFPEILQIIVFHTGVERRLKDSAYAQRRKTAKKALQTLGTLSSKRISKEALKE